MASIKGVQLKAITHYRGSDGEPGIQGNIYLHGKKVGYFSDDSRSGQMNIRVEHEKKKEIEELVADYYLEHPSAYESVEWFINELIQLTENEKMFKKYRKQGYPILVECRFRKRTESAFQEGRPYLRPNITACLNDDVLAQTIKEQAPVEYTVYRDLKDFIIE